jgi:4'-phosphopantetheinyl transferase
MNQVILAYSQLPGQLPAALPPASRARWRAKLSPARAQRLPSDELAQSHTLLGVALACRLLSAAGERVVTARELRYSAQGKPRVDGLPDFSIAHAGAWVLCALASTGAVGVDAEPLVAHAALPRWRRAFDAEERAAAVSPRAALAIWTAKEAALKAAGATLAEIAQVRVRGRRVDFHGRRWHCRSLRLSARTLIARLVTAEPVASLWLHPVPWQQALAA